MNCISFRVPSNFLPYRHKGHTFFLIEGTLMGQTGEKPAAAGFLTQLTSQPLQNIVVDASELTEEDCALLASEALSGNVLEIYYENVPVGDRVLTRIRGLASPSLGVPFLDRHVRSSH